MPLFDVTSPDGKRYRVTAPEGATQDDAIDYVQANKGSIKPEAEEPGLVDRAAQAVSGAASDLGAAVVDAGRGYLQMAKDAGNAAIRAGQRLGVVADPEEERLVRTKARNPEEAEQVRREYRENKERGGVTPGTAAGHLPVAELNRPAKSTEQVLDESRAANVDSAMRGSVGLRRRNANMPLAFKDAPQARRTEADIARELENPALRSISNTVEGRVERNVNQGLRRSDAVGKVMIEKTLGQAERSMAQTKTDEEYANESDAAKFANSNTATRALEKGGQALKQAGGGLLESYADLLGADESAKIFAKVNERGRAYTGAMGRRDGASGAIEDAASSIVQNAPALLTGLFTGAAGPALALMGLQSYGQSYSEAKSRGSDGPSAALYAGVNGVAEALGEMVGIKSFTKLLGTSLAGKPIRQVAANAASALAKEVPGEQLTTLIQFLADKGFSAGKSPNANLADYLEQAANTLVQTVLQSGMMYGGMAAVNRGMAKAGDILKPSLRDRLDRMSQTGLPGEVAPAVQGLPDRKPASEAIPAADVLGSATAETPPVEAATPIPAAISQESSAPPPSKLTSTVEKAKNDLEAVVVKQQKAVLDEMTPDVDAIFKQTKTAALAEGKSERAASKEAEAAAALAEAEHKKASNDLAVKIAELEGDPTAIMAAVTARPALINTLDAVKASTEKLAPPPAKAAKVKAEVAEAAPASPGTIELHDQLAQAAKDKLITKEEYAAAAAELLAGNTEIPTKLLTDMAQRPEYVSKVISKAWKSGAITDAQQAEASMALAGGRLADALTIVRGAAQPAITPVATESAAQPAAAAPVGAAPGIEAARSAEDTGPAAGLGFGSMRTQPAASPPPLSSVYATVVNAPAPIVAALRANGQLSSARVATALAHLAGVRIEWFQSKDGPSGMTSGDRNVLRLNADATHNILKVFGHELLHSIAVRNPLIYARLVERVKPMMRNTPEYRAFVERTNPAMKAKLSQSEFDDLVTEEMIADFMGEYMTEKGFWRNVFNGQTQSWIKSVKDAVTNALNDIEIKLRVAMQRSFGASHFLSPAATDLRRVQQALSDAFGEFIDEQAAAQRTVDERAHDAATSTKNDIAPPSEAQIASGNYKKGHVSISGLDIAIENPAGSKRQPSWPTLKQHYGYIKGVIGADKDHVDVFVKTGIESDYNGPVFIIDQNHDDGTFDEHKVVIGYPTEERARSAYLNNYTKGWESHVRGVRGFDSVDSFKSWLKDADLKKPAANDTVFSPDEDRVRRQNKEDRVSDERLAEEFGDNPEDGGASSDLTPEQIDKINAEVAAELASAERDLMGASAMSPENMEGDDFQRGGLIWQWQDAGEKWISGGFTIYTGSEGYTLEDGGKALETFATAIEAADIAAGLQEIAGQGGYGSSYDGTRLARIKRTAKVQPSKDEEYASELASPLQDPDGNLIRHPIPPVRKAYSERIRHTVAEVWRDLATYKGVKRFGKKSTAITFEGIAKDFGLLSGEKDRPRFEKAEITMRALLPNKDGSGSQWRDVTMSFPGDMKLIKDTARRADETIRLFFTIPKSDTAEEKTIHSDIVFNGNRNSNGREVAHLYTVDMGEGNLGRQFYQMAFNWAANNKVFITPDSMLTSVNSFRRTELMLSAVLRVGTTKFMAPHRDDQRVYNWIDRPQNKRDENENLANLILTSFDNVMYYIGDRLEGYRYDPKTDQIFRMTRRGTEHPVSNRMLARAESGRGDARLVAAGESTIRRTLVTKWIIEEIIAGKSVVEIGDELGNNTGKGATRGVVYSSNEDRGSLYDRIRSDRKPVGIAAGVDEERRKSNQVSDEARLLNEVPSSPGTAPIPDGAVRRFHVSNGAPKALAAQGVLMAEARGYEGPKAIYSWDNWRSADSYRGGPPTPPVVEFWVDPSKIHGGTYQFEDVKPNQIVAIHERWHDRYRYAKKEGISVARLREVEDADPDYGLAADQMEREGGEVLATGANRPGQGKTLKQRLYGAVAGATTIAAPTTKTMALANKAAAAAAYIPGAVVRPITSPIYDRLTQWGAALRDKTTIGQKLAHGLVADYGLPEPYIDARNDREIGINKVLRRSHELIDRIASLDRQEARVAYLWMQEKPNSVEERALMAVLPPDSVTVMTEMKREIDRLGREAIRLGLLSQESFNRNEMAYLHRTYQKHELENPDAVARASVAKTIRADAYKGRGLRDNVSVAALGPINKGDKFLRLEKRSASGALQNVGYNPVGKPIPQKWVNWTQDGEWEYRFDDRLTKHGEVGLWRDLTAQERGRLGEIDEVRYSFARTMISTVRDIETARLLDWVATNYGKSATDVRALGGTIKEPTDSMITLDTYSANDWVQVPSGDIKGTGIKKYGNLAGHHIPGHIWNDIRSVMNVQSNADVWKLYDSFLKYWKISKTALSPAVHANNVMSNFIFADLAGLDVDDIRIALKLIMRAKSGDAAAKAFMDRFYDSGSELGSMAQIELRRDVIQPLLDDMQRQQNGTLAQLSMLQGISLAAHGKVREGMAVIGASKGAQMAAAPFKSMIDLYRNEDAVFRLAKFTKETKRGLSDTDAGKLARAAFLDYQINAPWIQMLRRGPLPFLAFSYRAIPLLLKAAAKQPEKMIKYAAVAGMLNTLAYSILGAGGDEKEERRLMAKEKQGRALGIFPRMMRMPWNDEHGSPVFLDVRRWIPGGDIFDTDGSKAAGKIPQWLSVGGPLALFVELTANESLFTGKKITLETDTNGEVAVKVFDHLFKFLAPNMPFPNPIGWWADSAFDQKGLFQTYSWKSIQAAGSGETDTFGRERNLRQALFGAAGVKLGAYPRDVQEIRIKAESAAQIRELNEQQTKLKRMLQRKGITDAEFDKAIEGLTKKREKIVDQTGETLQ